MDRAQARAFASRLAAAGRGWFRIWVTVDSAADQAQSTQRSVDAVPRPFFHAIADVLGQPAAPAWTAIAGGALFWLGSQWPQARAPLVAADGLSRSDVLALDGLGLTAWAQSLPVILWFLVAVAVAIARTGPSVWHRRGTLGRAALAALALGSMGGWLAADARTPSPTWLDVQVVTQPTPNQPAIAAWHNQAGRSVAAPGVWSGQCTALADQQLNCTVVGPGVQTSAHLNSTRATATDAGTFAWVATLARPTAQVSAIRRSPTPAAAHRVDLQAGRAVQVPVWQADRVAAWVGAQTGPALLIAGPTATLVAVPPRLVAASADYPAVRPDHQRAPTDHQRTPTDHQRAPTDYLSVHSGQAARVLWLPAANWPHHLWWATALLALALAVAVPARGSSPVATTKGNLQ